MFEGKELRSRSINNNGCHAHTGSREGTQLRPDPGTHKEGKSSTSVTKRQARRSQKKAIRRISRIQSVTSISKVFSWKLLVGGFIVVMIGTIFKFKKTPDYKSAYDALPVSIPEYHLSSLKNGINDGDCHMEVPLPFAGWRLWTDEEHAFVGGRYDDRIAVLDKHGDIVSVVSLGYQAKSLMCILTGFYIGFNQHLIVIITLETVFKCLLFRIIFSADMQAIVHVNQIMLPEPTYIPHRFNNQTAGILALNPVQIFLYRYRRATDITLESVWDVPCDFTASGVLRYKEYFIISDFQNGDVVVFDSKGNKVNVLSKRLNPEKPNEPNLDQPGFLYEPMNVFLDTNGNIVVPCSDGSIHRYRWKRNNKWSLVVKSGQKSQDILTLNNKLYKVQDNVLHIYDINH